MFSTNTASVGSLCRGLLSSLPVQKLHVLLLLIAAQHQCVLSAAFIVGFGDTSAQKLCTARFTLHRGGLRNAAT